jgi:hypothetical protein
MHIKDSIHRAFISMLVGCMRVSVRYAWPLLVAGVAVTAVALYLTVTHIAINTDTGAMLDPNLPFQKAGREFDAAFPQTSGDIVIIIDAKHESDAEDGADMVAAALRKHTETIRSVYQPGGGKFFASHGLLYLTPKELWDLDDRLAEAEPFLGTLARDPSLRGLFGVMGKAFDEKAGADNRALLIKMFDRISGALESRLAGKAEPIRWRDEFFSGSAGSGTSKVKRAFVLAKPKFNFASLEPAADALDVIHRIGREIEAKDSAVRVRVTGSAAMDSEELVTVTRDAKLTTALAFGLVCVLLIWALRSPGPVVAVLFTLLCGLIWTAAFATVAIGSLNLISVCFAVLFIGMGVDFGIQFALRYHEESDRGLSKLQALEAATAGVGPSLTLAAAGAAISFFSFVPTSFRGLAELGIISGVSMVVALFANLTLLPALLSLSRTPRPRPRRKTDPEDVLTTAESLVYRQRWPIMAITTVVVIASATLLPRARFDFNPLNLKDPTTDAVKAFKDLASDPNSTPYTIEVLAKDLKQAESLSAKLDKLKEVDKSVTLASYVPDDQDEKLQIIDGMRTAVGSALEPDSVDPKPTVAEEAASIEHFHDQLTKAEATTKDAALATSMTRLDKALTALLAQPGWPQQIVPALEKQLLGDLSTTLTKLHDLLQAGPVDLKSLPADLRDRYIASDGRARVEVFPKEDLNNNHYLSEFVTAVQKIAPDASDSPVELLEGSRAVISSCIQASTMALVLTIIMHIIVLNGVVDALLVSLPLVLAMILTVATSVLLSFPFNFANIIALPLLIGLNNAYGAYLVVRRHTEPDIAKLLRSSTPRAVLFSGLTSICSFGVLSVSTHPGMKGMGILISLSLSFALLCALVVLPATMAVLDARGTANRS